MELSSHQLSDYYEKNRMKGCENMNLEEQKNEILSLDDIYFKDAFTKTEDKLNLEVNNANIDCMTSRNNKFSLDSDGNLIINSLTANSINIQNIFDSIYPVGSIYLTMNNTNPSTLFGGVWEQIKDTFLLCAGDKYPAGTTGGEAAHILTADEMPQHNHTFPIYKGSGTMGDGGTGLDTGNGVWSKNTWTTYRGGNQPHNNMPPYQTVYVWKRLS